MHFDTNTIQEFLESKYNYVHDVAPVADGWWSQALTFYSGEEKLVLRINQHPVDFQKDIFAWEHFNSAAIRIPEIKSTGNFNQDYFYCVSEFIEGTPLRSDHLQVERPADAFAHWPILSWISWTPSTALDTSQHCRAGAIPAPMATDFSTAGKRSCYRSIIQNILPAGKSLLPVPG